MDSPLPPLPPGQSDTEGSELELDDALDCPAHHRATPIGAPAEGADAGFWYVRAYGIEIAPLHIALCSPSATRSAWSNLMNRRRGFSCPSPRLICQDCCGVYNGCVPPPLGPAAQAPPYSMCRHRPCALTRVYVRTCTENILRNRHKCGRGE